MIRAASAIGATGGGAAIAAQLFGKAAGFCYLAGVMVGLLFAVLVVLRGRP